MKIESYLRGFDWGPFECHVDFTPADPSTGADAGACLYYALINGTDVSDYLAATVINQIEEAACSRFSEK
jgi:hypothetical protein